MHTVTIKRKKRSRGPNSNRSIESERREIPDFYFWVSKEIETLEDIEIVDRRRRGGIGSDH
jgi:hypothetical protein